MTKTFIEILDDIKNNKIKDGTKIRNIKTGDSYIFEDDNFKNENKGYSHFIRKCNLNEEFEFIEDDIKLYDLVKFGNFEWYIISESDKEKVLFMKDKLSPEKMQKYFDKRFLDDDFDVKFSFDEKNIWWNNSLIRMALNSTFLKYLDITKMNIMSNTVKLKDEISTTEDYVRLITADEVKVLHKNILKSDYEFGYWTMSPSYFGNGFLANEVAVYSTGELSNGGTWNGFGVRPVISVKSDVVLEKVEK